MILEETSLRQLKLHSPQLHVVHLEFHLVAPSRRQDLNVNEATPVRHHQVKPPLLDCMHWEEGKLQQARRKDAWRQTKHSTARKRQVCQEHGPVYFELALSMVTSVPAASSLPPGLHHSRAREQLLRNAAHCLLRPLQSQPYRRHSQAEACGNMAGCACTPALAGGIEVHQQVFDVKLAELPHLRDRDRQGCSLLLRCKFTTIACRDDQQGEEGRDKDDDVTLPHGLK
mmetsp:Transcript_37821/g.119510  ORF Transcript_37821/g.119510 Transcript_37821/m.119510 type:complete len:228 (-) Transcript_37821:128-811(-)